MRRQHPNGSLPTAACNYLVCKLLMCLVGVCSALRRRGSTRQTRGRLLAGTAEQATTRALWGLRMHTYHHATIAHTLSENIVCTILLLPLSNKNKLIVSVHSCFFHMLFICLYFAVQKNIKTMWIAPA